MTMQPVRSLSISAMSLNLPVVAGHLNRLPFSGTLTRLDVASDKPPNGSNGKRILVTHAAAEAALPGLLGMAVNLTAGFRGHDVGHKIGIVTDANIEGNALNIAGIIFCNDHPEDALAIKANRADLGFSFEAGAISIEGSLDADPLTIKGLTFTGASILLRTEAAYSDTSLAAAAAKDVVLVDRHLLQRLQKCGFTQCQGEGDTLSQAQLDAVLADQSIAERIALKQLVTQAGIWPRRGGRA
jgi:hypothetical protein